MKLAIQSPPPPRCAGVAMVRNEADVIELWARYNLRVLDSLHVIDHGSQDNTADLLAQLAAEGLPLVLHTWNDPSHTQAEAMRAVARPLAASGTVDFLVPLDADELLATDRASLHQMLQALPAGNAGAMRWRTYLPPASAEDDPYFFRCMHRYRSLELEELDKVIAPADLLATHSWQMGNHNLHCDTDGEPAPRQRLPLVLAHYPIRSQWQLRRKVMQGAHACRIKAVRIRHESWHWLALEQALAQAQSQGIALDLQPLALAYSYSNQAEQVAQQQVLEGAIDPAPELHVRYDAKPLNSETMTKLIEQSSQDHTEQLAQLGHAEFNTGNQAWRSGDPALALEHYSQASLLNPSLAVAHLGRARCLVQLGQLMAAREAFAAALRLEPANYSAWLEAGHLCRQMGELQQAAGAYQRAVDASPQRFEAHLAMARVLEQLGQPSVAEQAFAQALALAGQGDGGSPARMAETAHRMGRYRLESGDARGAVRALAEGLRALQGAQPDANLEAEIRIDMGEALWRLGRTEEAQAQMSAASAATAEHTLARLAALAFRLNLWQEAGEVARRNLALHPSSATATWNLAHLLAECWQMDEAEQLLARAETLAPMPNATAMRASIAGRRGDASEALRLYRQLAARPETGGQYASSAAMSSLYCDELSPQEVARLHRQLFEPLGQGARSRDSFRRAPLAGRRLKVGLVTADFHHQHPVNIFMQPVLRELDRARIELYVYFTGVSYDDQTRLAQRRTEHWVEVTTLNDVQLARRIDDDGIDVLLDLAGHTGQQRMHLFAKRAAPVQATYLGYPGSTGVPNMDWVVGDPVVTPPEADALCSERVYRLPDVVFCYAPEADYPLPAMPDAWAARPLTFGSFNNVPKLTTRTLALWARVLQAVPGSRLLLKAPSFGDASAVRAFRQRLQGLGVDLGRVEFRGPTGLADMMAEYADVDIALDPLPYNGGTTSLQALWMGVPVLTMEGGHFVSRMGASFMRAAGLRQWVAHSDDDLVAKAATLAADRDGLLAIKRSLRAQLLQRPGWNAAAQSQALAAAFEHMAASWR